MDNQGDPPGGLAASQQQLSFERFINKINQEAARDLVRSINL
jgi:hypothetical protein